MRIRILIAVLCVTGSAGAQSMTLAPVMQFKPLVEYRDTVAECVTMAEIGPVHPGEHGYLLRFGKMDSIARSIGAIWDTTGHLRSYSDTRGDLRGPPTPIARRGPKTSILIDFTKSEALLSNFEKGTDRGLLVSRDEAMNATSLGVPVAMLDRLHRQCGAPAYGKSDEIR